MFWFSKPEMVLGLIIHTYIHSYTLTLICTYKKRISHRNNTKYKTHLKKTSEKQTKCSILEVV